MSCGTAPSAAQCPAELWPWTLRGHWPLHSLRVTLITAMPFCTEPQCKSRDDSRRMPLLVWGLGVASRSTSHQWSATSYADCRCLREYSLKLHSLHSTVTEAPVLHIQHIYVYWWWISLAKPVSVLQNVEIWPCREQQRNSTNKLSASLLRTFGTVFQNICAHPHLQRTVSARTENPRLTAGLQPLRTLCWRVHWTELNTVVLKMSPFYFLNTGNSIKNETIIIIFGIKNLEEISDINVYKLVNHTWKM